MKSDDPRLDAWCRDLEERYLRDLTFPEVRRGLQALSRFYVERQRRFDGRAALDGAGKRAAFALFYSPIHFLVVDHVVRALGLHDPHPGAILDLGCGAGASGAAWSAAAGCAPRVTGFDRNPWALQEAARTYRHWGIRGQTVRADASRWRAEGAVVAGWVVNELAEPERHGLAERLLRCAGPVLVVEPIAARPVPWWSEWERGFERGGGRADLWRFPAELPDLVRRLDRAAGLDHRELTARSLFRGPKE